MLPIEEIRDLLLDRNASAVAKATGVHPNTIRSLKNGSNLNPSYEVIKKLSDYLEAK